MDQTIVSVALPAKSSAQTPTNAASVGRSAALGRTESRSVVEVTNPPIRRPPFGSAPSRLRHRVAVSERGFTSVGHLDPLRVGRGRGVIAVVPVPPFVRWSLRIALRRVLPLFLASEGGEVEVVPRAPHLLIAAVVDEVGAEHLDAVADEGVRAMP